MDLAELDDRAVFRLWARTMRELARRELIRSGNNPTGDYGEVLVAEQLGLQLAGNSTAAFDALAPDGTRYQIKARRLQGDKSSRQLGAIRNLDRGEFDYLVAVLFDENFGLKELWQFPIDLVREHAVYRKHVNAHIMHASGPILRDPRARLLKSDSTVVVDAEPSSTPVDDESMDAGSLDENAPSSTDWSEPEGAVGEVEVEPLIDQAFSQGLGYALGGSPWRRGKAHEAGVFRRGGAMWKRKGRTPAEALTQALTDALTTDAEHSIEPVPPGNEQGGAH